MSYKNWEMLNESFFNLGVKSSQNMGLMGSKMQEAGVKPPLPIKDEDDEDEEDEDMDDVEGEDDFEDSDTFPAEVGDDGGDADFPPEDLEGGEDFAPDFGAEDMGGDMAPEEDDFDPSQLEIDPSLLGAGFEDDAPMGDMPVDGVPADDMGDVPPEIGGDELPMLDDMGDEEGVDLPADDMGDDMGMGDDLADAEGIEADDMDEEHMRNYMKHMGKAHMHFMKSYMKRENAQYNEFLAAAIPAVRAALPAIGRAATNVGRAALANPEVVGQAAHAAGQGFGGWKSGYSAGANIGQHEENAANMRKKMCKDTGRKMKKQESYVVESHDDFLSSLRKGAKNEAAKKNFDGMTASVYEDALIPPSEREPSTEPKAGEVGYAPQGRVGAIGAGGYQMSDIDLPVLGESKKKANKVVNECFWQAKPAGRPAPTKANQPVEFDWMDLAFNDSSFDFLGEDPVDEGMVGDMAKGAAAGALLAPVTGGASMLAGAGMGAAAGAAGNVAGKVMGSENMKKKMGKKCMSKCENINESFDLVGNLRKNAKNGAPVKKAAPVQSESFDFLGSLRKGAKLPPQPRP